MGCDIHAYVEYKEYDSWWLWANPYFGRNYNAFELMAGVRGEHALFEPRGIPKDISFSTVTEYTCWISNSQPLGDNEVSTKSANEWLARGDSVVWDEHRISHPDWHTPSWLTVDELKQVRDSLNYISKNLNAIIAAMDVLGNDCTRLVFWFDN